MNDSAFLTVRQAIDIASGIVADHLTTEDLATIGMTAEEIACQILGIESGERVTIRGPFATGDDAAAIHHITPERRAELDALIHSVPVPHSDPAKPTDPPSEVPTVPTRNSSHD